MIDAFIAAGIAIIGILQVLLQKRLESYVTSFSKKEGEIDAIQRNLDKVLKQQESQTAVVKEIEAKIAGGLWLDQEQWKLKRDIYVSLVNDHQARLSALWEGGKCEWTASGLDAYRAQVQQSVGTYGFPSATARLALSPAMRVLLRRIEGQFGLIDSAWKHFVETGQPDPAWGHPSNRLIPLQVACENLAIAAGEDLGVLSRADHNTLENRLQQNIEREDRLRRILEDKKVGRKLSDADNEFYEQELNELFGFETGHEEGASQ